MTITLGPEVLFVLPALALLAMAIYATRTMRNPGERSLTNVACLAAFVLGAVACLLQAGVV